MGKQGLYHVNNATKSLMVAAIVAATISVSGCTGDRPAEQDPLARVQNAEAELREAGAIESAESLADGEVSEDDYFAAARLYQSCLRAVGVELKGPQLSPVDNVTLEWLAPTDMPAGADVASKVEVCTSRWSPMITAYEATHPAVMNDDLLKAVRECMSGRGLEVPVDATNIRSLVGPVDDRNSPRLAAVEQCVVDKTTALYPELYGVTFVY